MKSSWLKTKPKEKTFASRQGHFSASFRLLKDKITTNLFKDLNWLLFVILELGSTSFCKIE
jgi:hypothetical protein